MNGLIREIYGLSEFDAMYNENEKENAFVYLIEDEHDDMRAERNID
ncbi:hypothetical protein M4L90_02770 [Staphylococcus equorum]|uniref:Uncharacterized protein n=1 Tax=Staphylococcus equorum TaxID=246432 RepID=A0A9X4L0X1_9STAP|nr:MULTISPECIES: hypothetical protein [Staphylococcus]MDG0818812.1 hypothetical protein [Staphylococcus equorum]MDG0839453.1 hypothetical protein [Staphylococcus equorum]MDG0844821.1 hypothetical protein [Staphylococcus equorum]CCI60649.1 putative uncharacterized protein [Staphylococcus equorum subsp. equorum Mu2]